MDRDRAGMEAPPAGGGRLDRAGVRAPAPGMVPAGVPAHRPARGGVGIPAIGTAAFGITAGGRPPLPRLLRRGRSSRPRRPGAERIAGRTDPFTTLMATGSETRM